jgi:hypothetical protein
VVTTSARSESFAHRPADPPPRPRSKNGKLPPEVDLRRLCDAVARDRRELAPFRRNRLEMVRQYAGAQYGDNAAAAEVPVNLLGLYVQVITQAVVSDTPGSCSRRSTRAGGPRSTRWSSGSTTSWCGCGWRRRTAGRVRRPVLGRDRQGRPRHPGRRRRGGLGRGGRPAVPRGVDPDDVACDTTARTFSRCAYHACRYRLPVALANELYAKGRAEQVRGRRPGGRGRRRGRPDLTPSARPGGWRDQLEDECDLWEVYLARHKMVVTLRDSGGVPDPAREPVRVQRWVGPS